jgi:GTP-binding protein
VLFVDEAEIEVRGGRGGDGCVSFRREANVPRGGPDGGDGGRGGSVFIVARPELNTLTDLVNRRHWHARSGASGSGKNCSGKSAPDLVIGVPVGTIVSDRHTGAVLKDVAAPGQRVCVARGGRGGRGNAAFATPTHQAPREAEPGEPGEERSLRLVLKLLADVGVVGLPNAGKSTLVRRVSRARPKTAAYPFTTLVPHLGIVEMPGFRRFVIADLPGLIEGAHEGHGLGDQFLRHVERTRVILHLVDLFPSQGQPTPADAYRTVRNELEKYNPALAAKPELVVGNKIDLGEPAEPLAEVRDAAGGECLPISAVAGRGLDAVLNRLWQMLEAAPAATAP